MVWLHVLSWIRQDHDVMFRTMTSCHVVPSKYEAHDFVRIQCEVLSKSIILFSTSQSDNEPERASNSCYDVPSLTACSFSVVFLTVRILHSSNSLCPKIWLKRALTWLREWGQVVHHFYNQWVHMSAPGPSQVPPCWQWKSTQDLTKDLTH